ncbi:MAG: hypothetical protein NT094_00440, partial [Candidatus Staskawiczbacteria bacterium]|nr:hypothetical protein [Candidatus Staskawiczbacteria bacterium]
PTPTQTGVEVTWTAVPIGGAEPYTYDWSGTDNLGLGEHTISVKKTYTTPGAPPWNTKGAKVIVTSGDGQTAPDANCSVRVSPAVAATCHASPSSTQIGVQVTWTVVASGGNSTYTYSDWSGDDGLTGAGTTTTKTYDTPGTKHANITVESNGYDTNPTPTTCSVNIYQNGACGGAATPPSGTRSLYLYDGDPLGTNLPYPLVQTLCASPAPADPLVPNLPMNYGSQTQWTCPGTGTGSTSVICYARREAITIGTCGVASYYDAGRTYPATETFDNTDGNLCETGHFDGATRPTLPFTPPQTISWTCSGSTACTATRIANPTGSCGEASNYGDVAGRTYVQGEPFP